MYWLNIYRKSNVLKHYFRIRYQYNFIQNDNIVGNIQFDFTVVIMFSIGFRSTYKVILEICETFVQSTTISKK